MIKHWQLRNFKSFKAPPPIALSKINVLAGANSSGKSSIIQSILLLKQTLQYGSENRPITLNGPLLRVGAFDDVRNFEAKGESLEIGFKIDLVEGDGRGLMPAPWIRAVRRYMGGSDSGPLRSISLDLAYNEAPTVDRGSSHIPSATSLTPQLRSSFLSTIRAVGSESNKIGSARYTLRDLQGPEDDERSTFSLKYDVELDDDSRIEIFSERPESSVKGGVLSFFLPSWIGVNFNAAAKEVMELAEGICNSSDNLMGERLFSKQPLSKHVVRIINQWLQDHGDDHRFDEEDGPTGEQVRNTLLPYLKKTKSAIFDFLRAEKPDEALAADITQLREKILICLLQETEPTYDLELEIPRNISAANEVIKEYFKTGIKYLGPLRDSPRPVYQPEALESTTDVGYRGEHTAAVLDLNAGRRVQYHRPPSGPIDLDHIETPQPQRASLHDAVVDWLVYLGVADDVVTTDAGVYGNRLQVSTDGLGRLHDLTNVGVGVSQVLPIVVMALLAPRGSLLIFEQPELHLHPKVQARLADFFIALALDGKQSLLETHSEYIVDRFRLRIALSEGDEVRSLINVLFSEKMEGESILRSVEISEYGSVIDWPADFFDQSQRDVSLIVQAAAARRRLKLKN